MEKKQLTQEQIQAAKKEMQSIAMSGNREEQIARIINETYDPELPVNDIIAAIMNIGTAEAHETVYYFVPTLPVKKAYILSGNCNVTEIAVVPSSKNTLAFTAVVTPNYYICLDELLNGDHDVLSLYAEAAMEALNREEMYSVLALIDAAAVAQGNVLGLATGKTKMEYPDLVALKRMVRKYGSKLVLITGADVTDSIDLLAYDANKFLPVNIKDIVDVHYAVESLEVDINGVTKEVIAADVAYLVAVSDSKNNKPGYFIRRKLSPTVAGLADTTVVTKERAMMVTGAIAPVAGVEKFARGLCGLEQVGSVISNPFCVAKFVQA